MYIYMLKGNPWIKNYAKNFMFMFSTGGDWRRDWKQDWRLSVLTGNLAKFFGTNFTRCETDFAICGIHLARCETDLAKCETNNENCKLDLAWCETGLVGCKNDLATCGMKLTNARQFAGHMQFFSVTFSSA